MKKIVCFLAVALIIASVAFAAGKMKITDKDLPGLKGSWEGMLSWGVMAAANSAVKLEILNDKVPLKAKLTVRNVPDQIASQLGITGGMNEFESEEGVITTQGTLMWTGPAKNFLEVTLESNKKGSGWYFFKGVKGDISLSKK